MANGLRAISTWARESSQSIFMSTYYVPGHGTRNHMVNKTDNISALSKLTTSAESDTINM